MTVAHQTNNYRPNSANSMMRLLRPVGER